MTSQFLRILLSETTISCTWGVYNYVQSVVIFRFMSDCTVNPVEAYHTDFELLNMAWLAERCVDLYFYNAATGEFRSVPLCCILDQKQPVYGFVITHIHMEAQVGIIKARLMTMSKARSAAKAAGIALYFPVSVLLRNAFEGADDNDYGPAEPIYGLQDLDDESAGGVSDFQRVRSLSEKVGLLVPAAVDEAQKVTAESLAGIPENSDTSATRISGSGAFKTEN